MAHNQQGLSITSNAADIIRQFERLPKDMQEGVRTGLTRGLLLAETAVLRETGVKLRRGAAGLAGRLTSVVRVGGPMAIEGRIGFRKTKGFPYELSQEFGAKAKPGGAMAIPVTSTARRYPSPRDFPKPLVLIKTRAFGSGAVLIESGRRSSKLQYVFVKSIKPRLGFMKAVRGALPAIEDEIWKGYVEGVRK